MKTLFISLLVLSLIALTWLSLGWMALLVIPSLALFALMTFAPQFIAWAEAWTQRDDLDDAKATVRKHIPTHQTGLPLHSAGRSAAH